MNEYQRLDWTEILNKISDFSTSFSAREAIQKLSPKDSAQDAQNQCQKIIESISLVEAGQRPYMESLDIFTSWYSRLDKKATLKTLELKDLRHFCIECLALKEILSVHQKNWLAEVGQQLLPAQEPLSAIEQIMTPDGEIRNDASETVYKLLQEKTSETKKLQNTLEKIVKNFDMESLLQEKYVTTREGRWVLPIKSGMRHQIQGVIHASSQSKQTVFMEPQEVVTINNRLKQIDAELEEEIERLLRQLSEYLHGLKKQIKQSRDLMLEMDILLSYAQLSHLIKANGFEFSDSEMQLDDLRHPMLSIGPQEVIPNSVYFNKDKRILLLSGPNAGGKTVLLKSIGLAAHMARCGLPIPADKNSKIIFFDTIALTLGDEQSVDAHLSTFAAHLKNLDRAAHLKGLNHLVLIDEICGSTDPEEGAALAKSFIETYSENGVLAVITSHLGSLKLDWQEGSSVQQGSLEFSADRGPTYQLLKGIAGQSMALQTAQRSGVSKKIIDQALNYLKPEKRKQLQDLEEIESLKDKLHRLMEETKDEKSRLNVEKMKFEKMMASFEKEKDNLLRKKLKESEEKFDAIINEESVKDIFKKHDKIIQIKAELPKIIKASTAQDKSSIESAEDFSKAYPAGSKVFIKSLGQDAIVQGLANNKGLVQVLSKSMRLTVPWQDLTPPMSPQNPTRDILRSSGHFSYSPSDKEPVIDLRGLSSDEALAKLDIELDKAASHDQDRVKVIHGHGTNTLKKLVRSFLSKSIYVKKWQAGSAETGGDGITWAEL